MSTIASDDVALRLVPTISSSHPDAVDEMAFSVCLDTYTCECVTCQLEREERVQNGVRAATNANPFQRRPLRRAA